MARNFKHHCLVDFTHIYYYHENTEQLNNEIKQNLRNKTFHIGQLNARNAAYQAFTKFKRQELKHSRTYKFNINKCWRGCSQEKNSVSSQTLVFRYVKLVKHPRKRKQTFTLIFKFVRKYSSLPSGQVINVIMYLPRLSISTHMTIFLIPCFLL